jgi:transposase InsO family protein
MTNDFSRYRKSISLKLKNEVEQAIKEFIAEIEAKEYRIKIIRKDEGTEFGSAKFKKWLKEKGIKEEDSAPYTLEQNGLAERSIRLIYEKARSMLLATDLPSSL